MPAAARLALSALVLVAAGAAGVRPAATPGLDPTAASTAPGRPRAPAPASAVVTAGAPSAETPLADPAEIVVRRGDTLLAILARAGVADGEAHDAVGTLRQVANPRRLRSGMRLKLELEPAAAEVGQRLSRLVWPVDVAGEVHLVRGDDGAFTARHVARAVRRELIRLEGEIVGSLHRSARRVGIGPEGLGQVVALLSRDLDLQREVHPGDRFEAVIERALDDAGGAAGADEVLFVGFAGRERAIAAYRFAPSGRDADFFDRHGQALRKWLLRTPVDGARLSSPFGPRRHPILGYTRLHRGIDFAAPPGTPVLAAGDGVVEFAGRNRGYGNYVRLAHRAGYGTAYAHLRRIAAKVRPGRRVRQGEVIGEVGSTGLSTGPHLHYEVLHRGEAVDPKGLETASAEPLGGGTLADFLAWRDRIDSLRGGRRAAEPLVAQRTD
jgi:murein DD-endopeptidase MepM/ murein hydrolase activator NlpD